MNRSTLLALACALFAPSCRGGGGGGIEVSVPVPTVGEPFVVNVPDSFSIVGTGALMHGTKDYAWTCTRSQAKLDLSSSTFFGSGSFRLEIFDASGASVHDNVYTTGLLDAGIRAVTRAGGMPGVWILHFTFMGFVLDGFLDLDDDNSTLPDEVRLATGYSQASGELTYPLSWAAGPKTLHLGWTMDSGSVQIQIWDGTNALVFDHTYTAPLPIGMDTFPDTASGASGVWTLKISFTNVVDGLSIEVPF